MKNTLVLFALLVASTGFAFPLPPSFESEGKKAVFSDFQVAHYKLIYDAKAQTAQSIAVVSFKTFEAGQPIFDSVPDPVSVVVDGITTRAPLINSPDSMTQFRKLDVVLPAGDHSVVIESPITMNLSWGKGEVGNGFFMDDVRQDRYFLERYIPASFEWDAYEMDFEVIVKNASVEHSVFTNGAIIAQSRTSSEQTWKVQFPKYFSNSSVYFHLGPTGSFKRLQTEFQRTDGTKFPVEIYALKEDERLKLENYAANAKSFVDELQRDFGPWPHERLLIFAVGWGGGMEYAGATSSAPWALAHELTHSYYARGVMPRDGDAGWIDEAVATWYSHTPQGPTTLPNLPPPSVLVSGSPYARRTQGDGYGSGARLLAYFNHKFGLKGGIQGCLTRFYQAHLFDRISTERFRDDLGACFGSDLTGDFDVCAYGKAKLANDALLQLELSALEANPIHRPWTPEEIQRALR